MFMAKDDSTQDAKKVAKAKIAQASRKKEKQKKPSKGNIFPRMGKAIKKFWRDFRGENKKIIWPDWKTVAKSTGVVLAMVAAVGVAIYLVDLGLARGVSALAGLASKMGAEAETTTAAFAQALNGLFLPR